ncbi:MAG: DCC1-like thiol-disulfide oxidoreductase family protein [Acidimicrobiaceae bacterium]|nr:DCC1-like thiol-disulfide oxidoreductase family protein [Acidimicrobiaceae bacterium]
MLLVFDGDCRFCRVSAGWIERRLPDEVQVRAWQSLELADVGLTHEQVETSLWWVHTEHKNLNSEECEIPNPVGGHAAIGHALISMGGVWSAAGNLILHPPFNWLAQLVYTLIARNRYCLIKQPDPE